MKRLITQIIFFITTNINIKGFITGTIYKGKVKNICLPGLNCYSCPGAVGSCPIGSLQAVIGGLKYQISFYVFGLLSLLGITLGRFICGWLCPFGLVQDLVYKLKVKKLKIPTKTDFTLRKLKYIILILTILLPMFLTNEFGIAQPYFCKYICPSGTLLGGFPLLIANPPLRNAIGLLFSWKVLLLLIFIVGALFIFRPFCKYICPLGALYGIFNPVSFYGMKIDNNKCVNCKKCEKVCPMQVPVISKPNHSECIRCGICKSNCPTKAIIPRKIIEKNN